MQVGFTIRGELLNRSHKSTASPPRATDRSHSKHTTAVPCVKSNRLSHYVHLTRAMAFHDKSQALAQRAQTYGPS